MKKRKYNKTAEIILKSLAAGALVVTVLALPGIAPALAIFIPKNKKERYYIKRSVNRLEHRGLITTRIKDNKLEAQLTKRGSYEAKLLHIRENKLQTFKKWDGKWRIVFFDIPESKRPVRRALAYILITIGMFGMQKSTFVFPYDCRSEIEFITKYFGVTKCVQYVVAEELSNTATLKRYFKL